MNTDTIQKIAICVATYNRPDMFKDLLESLAKIGIPAGIQLELRIVDNDEKGTSEAIVDEFRTADHPFDGIEYRIQAEQNIALARNTAIAIGPAEVFVFVDDDEVVRGDWLLNLWGTYVTSDADAVFGPVYGRCAIDAKPWLVRGKFFNKMTPSTGTELEWKETRTSNTLVRGSWFFGDEAVRFDARFGRSGGSDSFLFATLKKRGARFFACQDAVVWEEIPRERASFKWLWKRWYRNGLVFDRVSMMVGENQYPLLRATKRLGAIGINTIAGLPKLALGKPESVLKALLRIPLMLGGLRTWMKADSTFNYVEYEKVKNLEGSGSNGEGKNLKVTFLTNIISPYRAPVFKELATTKGWDFKVLVDAEKEFDREWDVQYDGLPWKKTSTFSIKRTVKNLKPIPFDQKITLHIPYGIIRDLMKEKPDLVISHELGFRTIFAAIYCMLHRIPLVVWAYQSRVSAGQGGARLFLRKWLLKRARLALGMGKQAHDVLKLWGVPKERIVDALNAADNKALKSSQEHPEFGKEVESIRSRYAKGKKMAIIVGRLIPLKGIDHVLQAWKSMSAATRNEWSLVFVGNGPLASIIENCGDESISLTGFVKPDEIASWYAAADLHIFPSCGDVWGLVVNEASICGTPTLCSVYAGCYDDLIHDGKDGLGIDFSDTKNSPDYLERALLRSDLGELGKEAQRHVDRLTTENLANSFRYAANRAIAGMHSTNEVNALNQLVS